MSHPTPHWHRNTGLAFVFRHHMKLLSQAFFFFKVLSHPKTYASTMGRKGAMLKRPAAGLSSDDKPAAEDVAHVEVCCWPAHTKYVRWKSCVFGRICVLLCYAVTALVHSLCVMSLEAECL